MSKLLGCFGQNKNKREELSSREVVEKRRRQSKENNELVYFNESQARNQHGFNGNVSKIYRFETNSQNYKYDTFVEPDANRPSTSHPFSAERRSVSKDCSAQERPSFEMQNRRKNSLEPRNLMAYAVNVACAPQTSDDTVPYGIPEETVPRRSTRLNDSDKEMLIAKQSLRCEAEESAEEFYKPGITKDKMDSTLFGIDSDKIAQNRHSTLRMSKADSNNFSPRTSHMGNQNLLRLASDNISNEGKMQNKAMERSERSKNIYLEDTVMPTIFYVEEVKCSPISARKYVGGQSPLSGKKLPSLKSAEKRFKPLKSEYGTRLSVPSRERNSSIKIMDLRSRITEDFPLANRGEAIIAAPAIGTYRSLRRRNYDGVQTYPMEPFYDGGFAFADNDIGRYRPCVGCSKRRMNHQIFATQVPEIPLPVTSINLEKNTQGSSNTPEKNIENLHCNVKEEHLERAPEPKAKESFLKLISYSQPNDDNKEKNVIFFSPEKFFPVTNDGELKWRIIIKREDES